MSKPYVQSGEYWPPKVDLFGIGVSIADYAQSARAIVDAAKAGRSGLVTAAAAHAVVELTQNEERKKIGNAFHLVTTDGQPVRWAINWLHKIGMKERVYGPELTLRTCELAAEEGVSIFLYGGTEVVLEKLQDNLQKKFPNLNIAGSYCPPFRPLTSEEDQAVIQQVADSGAGIVLIGLGCPKQDLFAYQHRESIKAVQMCVGAAFDFHAGVKPMAPKWMQDRGLEWFYRLTKEPKRLFRRYLVTNCQFVSRFLVAAFKQMKK